MSEQRRPVIIRRKRKVVQGYHGGSWKIALADFMTALMALFLVLWLLSTASPMQLQGIAEYFRTPLSVAMAGGDRPTASTSAIPGGGPDPAFSKGERARIDLRAQTRPGEVRRNLKALQRRIETAIEANPELRELRSQMRFEMTEEGLRIQLMDSKKKPMFELGSDRVIPYTRELLRTIAPLLNKLPNRLSISGHTDSLPFPGGEDGYSNWELSSDRANASRRELIAGGLEKDKLLRVVGMGDRVPVPGSQPREAVNRRITLTVLSPKAESRIRNRSDAFGLGPLRAE